MAHITGSGVAFGEYPGTALGVSSDIVVGVALGHSGVTVGPAELEVVEVREEILEELLFRNTPTCGVGGEETPAVAGSELVVSVVAAHHLEEVLACVVVVHAADVTCGTCVRTGSVVSGAGAQTRTDGVVGVQILILVRTVVTVAVDVGCEVVREFHTEHRGDVVGSETIVVESLRASVETCVVRPILGVLSLAAGNCAGDQGVGLIVVEIVHLDQGAGLVAVEVVGSHCGDAQSLEERSHVGQFEVVVETLAVLLGVAGEFAVDDSERVAVLLHIRIVAFVALGVNADHRVGLIDVVKQVPVHIHITGRESRALAEGGVVADGEVRGDLNRDVAGETVAVVTVVVRLDDRVVVRVVGAEVVVDSVSSAVERHGVGLVHCELLVGLSIPIRICVGGIAVLIGCDDVVREAVLHLRDVGHGILPLHERSPALHVAGDDRLGEGEHGGEVHRGLFDLAALGGDEDHTVLCADTVDGGGCVLQHGHALDVVRVEFIEHGHVRVGLEGGGIRVVGGGFTHLGGAPHDTVHDDDRGTEASDVDGVVEHARLAGVLVDHKAGDLTLKGCDTVDVLGVGDILRVDLADSAGQRLLLLDSIAHDDGLLEKNRVFFQGHVHLRGGLEADGLIADGDEFESAAFRDGDLEVTVQISHGAGLRALNHHGHADERLLLLVSDFSGHLDAFLREQGRGAEDEPRQNGHCTH